jgi:hypothetical protein
MADFLYRFLTRRNIASHVGLGLMIPTMIAIVFFGAPVWLILVVGWGGAIVYAKLFGRYVRRVDWRRRDLEARG